MRIRSWSLIALALLALAQLSCATAGLTPEMESMPAARAGLPFEYRLFYDALEGHGDWLLIEPIGYVFRPYDADEYWHPDLYGYWAPSEWYGWVWISSEPYGWATYHYGEWYYDDFQGWVWIPGSEWGPAWVSWVATPDYVGWAPLSPPGLPSDRVPGGPFLYVRMSEFPAADLSQQVRAQAQIGDALGTPLPVDNLRQRDGVTFNAGPPFGLIERRVGPLQRVKLEDLPVASGGPARAAARRARPGPEAGPAASRSAPRASEDAARVEAVRRAAEAEAQQTRSITQGNAPPPRRVGLVRPEVKRGDARARRPDEPSRAEPPRPDRPAGAGADSTRPR
jgi:hypothetical protein